MKKILAFAFVITLIISIFPRCAKIVAPTGGPKDSLPPVLVRSNPTINSTNFKGEKITLTYDEFITLKDYQKKLAISPPLAKNPEIVQRGKSIDIKFKDSLKNNTTYTIYFADAVADNNEGNPIKNFMFAFSTGSIIDSLTLSGTLHDAYTLLPAENVFVMLYDQNIDSLPIKAFPRYLTRTNKKCIFTFHNLQSNDYKIFALIDNNTNYKFDQASEEIAFIDTLVRSTSLNNPSQIDTSLKAKRAVNLNLFKEENRIQALTGNDRKLRDKLSLSFTKKPEGEVKLTPLNFKADSSWYLTERNAKKDSIIYWITNSRISAMDTLKIQLSYLKTDSLQRLKPKLDTLKFTFSTPEEPKRKGRDKEKLESKKKSLQFLCSIKKDEPAIPHKPIEIAFPQPVKDINLDRINLLNLKDSSEIKGIKLLQDTLNPRVYRIYNQWITDIKYRLHVLPNAFQTYNNLANDTFKVDFVGADPEKYGQINLTIKNCTKQLIVELLSEKKEKIFEKKITKSGEKVVFDYISPGKYTFRFIEDSNGNGQWDTGWYLKGFQPEKVIYYFDPKTKGILNVRANWENDITFDLKKGKNN